MYCRQKKKTMPETSQSQFVSKKNPPSLNIIDNNIYLTSNHSKSIINADNNTIDQPPLTPQAFCLRWNNYQSNLTTVFTQLLQDEQFVDVTLSCDGYAIKAHKIVLSACSPYFQSIFYDNPCQHPIVIMRDIRWTELQPIVEFMYRGEINVSQDQIEPLLKVAQLLKVRGLADVNNATTAGCNSTATTTTTTTTGGSGGGNMMPVNESKIASTSINNFNNYVAADDDVDDNNETMIKDEMIERIKPTIKRSRTLEKEWNDNVYDLLATPPASADKRHKWSSSVKNENHSLKRNDIFSDNNGVHHLRSNTFSDNGVHHHNTTQPISVPSDSAADISDGDTRMKDVIDSVAAGDLVIDEDKVSENLIIFSKIYNFIYVYSMLITIFVFCEFNEIM